MGLGNQRSRPGKEQPEVASGVRSDSPSVPHVLRHLLTGDEARQVRELAAASAAEYRSVDDEGFLADVGVIAHELPVAVRRCAGLARLHDTAHVVLISGNYIDGERLERTPAHWRQADTRGSREAAFTIMIYAALLGAAIGWAGQQSGRLVTDVLPIPGDEDSLLSSSSSKQLGWHTEDAFSEARGDYVGLFCLRNPTRTPTTVSCLTPATMPADVLRTLLEPRFLISADQSHAALWQLSRPRPSPVPLISGPLQAPVLRVDRDFTTAIDGDAAAELAIQALIEHLDRNTYPIMLAPGDLCFLDNRGLVHGRASFRPRYDGYDRWLKRVNVVVDLRRTRPSRACSRTRVIG